MNRYRNCGRANPRSPRRRWFEGLCSVVRPGLISTIVHTSLPISPRAVRLPLASGLDLGLTSGHSPPNAFVHAGLGRRPEANPRDGELTEEIRRWGEVPGLGLVRGRLSNLLSSPNSGHSAGLATISAARHYGLGLQQPSFTTGCRAGGRRDIAHGTLSGGRRAANRRKTGEHAP